MADLSEEAYERVAALRNSYRQRFAVADQRDALSVPVEQKAVQSISEAEAQHRRSVESAEAGSANLIRERWNRRAAALSQEFAAAKKRRERKPELHGKLHVLEKNFYREQFLEFWSDVKRKQLVPREAKVTGLLMSAYKHDMIPFAADPVECWGSGMAVPPELQQGVELRDRHGGVSLPPFHELSMKMRDAYDHYRDGDVS